MAEALYRKYRPQVFADVVGQEHIERTLKNAIDQDKVSHAYLFTGPRGTGKTTTARLLAKALLCENGPTSEPDGTCEDCELIAAGEHPDVYELDAASRTGVENVREEIIGRVQYAPTRGRYKVYIIDEVHMLSTAAFNALLKTLEEPPSHVVFILATTDPQKVPETIHSRCQRFDFRRISPEEILSRLGAICEFEGIKYDPEALDLIARRADGGMRNALTSLEQLIAFGNGEVTMKVAERMLGSLDSSDMAEIVKFIGTRDAAKCFTWTSEFVETGADLAQFTRDLAEHMRNMYVMSLTDADVALDIGEDQRKELVGELPMYGSDRLARILGILGDLLQELKTSTNSRLSFEVALTRMIRPQTDLTLEALAERIEELEAGRGAAPVNPAAAFAPPTAAQVAAAAAVTSAAAQPAVTVPAQAQVVAQPAAVVQEPVAQAQAAVPVEDQPATQAAAQAAPAQVQEQAAAQTAARPAEAASTVSTPTAATSTSPASAATATAQPAATGSSAPAAQAATQEGPGVTVLTFGDPMDAARVDFYRNESAVQRTWKKVSKAFKESNEARSILLLNAQASLDAAAGRILVDIPAPGAFLANMAKDPKVTEALSAAFAQVEDTPVPFTLVIRQLDATGGNVNVQAASKVDTIKPAVPAVTQAAAQPAMQASAQAQPVSQPVSEPVQTPQPAQAAQPTQAPSTSAAPVTDDPYYDEVPLDAYDAPAAAAYDPTPASAEATPPWDAASAVATNAAPVVDAQTSPTPEVDTSVFDARVEEAQAASAVADAAPASSAETIPPWDSVPAPTAGASAATGSEPTAEELSATLASAFGDGLSFEPVE